MSRNQITDGIILKSYHIAEIHKGLTLLTENMGLLNCTAYGAWKEKSKLRSATQLFSYATFYLYYNPVNKGYKISDIANKDLYEKIRESVSKYFIACLWAEVILKSFGGGENSSRLFSLLLQSLDCLNFSGEKDAPFLIVQFLWRFLTFSGLKPELDSCNECNKNITLSDPIYFDEQSASLLCSQCAVNKNNPLNPGIRIYLHNSLKLPIKNALTLKIEKNAIENLKKITYDVVESHLEIRLNSLKSGRGII